MNAARALSVKEAAEILGFGVATLYEKIADDTCPVPVIWLGRARRIPAAQVHFFAMFGRTPDSNDELVEFVRSMSDEAVTA